MTPGDNSASFEDHVARDTARANVVECAVEWRRRVLQTQAKEARGETLDLGDSSSHEQQALFQALAAYEALSQSRGA